MMDACRCSVGRTKFQRVMMGSVDQELYIGRRAQELRGLLRIKYPVAHGIVRVESIRGGAEADAPSTGRGLGRHGADMEVRV